MKKRKIDVNEYAGFINKSLPTGILLTTKADEKVNSMVIGWGTLGINWGQPVFVCYVRDSRFTKQLIDQNLEFTINVPIGEFDREIIKVCGKESGRDVDKIRKLGLTLVEAESIAVPAIKEFPLTLECRVIYSQREDIDLLEESIRNRAYRPSAEGVCDIHTAYYGRIQDAYIIEED